MKGTTLHRPAHGSHPKVGGPEIISRAVNNLMSCGKALGGEVELPKLWHQTRDPSTNHCLDDGPWEGLLT